FEVTGKNPLIDIALELERIALQDDYFGSRRLYPNVDFYSGIIYEAMGLPVAMFPVLFAIARTAGWMAQWAEMLLDEEQKITRPESGKGRASVSAAPQPACGGSPGRGARFRRASGAGERPRPAGRPRRRSDTRRAR